MTAKVGADGLDLFRDPRPELLADVTGIRPKPGEAWVDIQNHLGFRSTQRLWISDVDDGVAVATWPAETAGQARFLYDCDHKLGTALVGAAIDRGWIVEPSPHIAFYNSPSRSRLYLRPPVAPLDYVACWQEKGALARVRYPREEVERQLWAWLKQRGLADDSEDAELRRFLNEFLRMPQADMRPGLRFRRVWTFDEAARLGPSLAGAIRSEFNAVFAAAHEPPLAAFPADSFGAPAPAQGHAFISYVREDSSEVDALQKTLEETGIRVWRDTSDLRPGENWRAKIRSAIINDALVFIACFSSRSAARQASYQNKELLLAIDQLRRRAPDDPWLIPVRFDDCHVPDYELGAGRTLASIHRADLFGPHRDREVRRLAEAVRRLLTQSSLPGFFARMRELKAFRDEALRGQPSDRALSQMVGVSVTTVGEWLQGTRFPQDAGKVSGLAEIIAREASKLGVPVPSGSLDLAMAYREEEARRAETAYRAVQQVQGAQVLAPHEPGDRGEPGASSDAPGVELGDGNVQVDVFAGALTGKLASQSAYLEQVRRIAPPALYEREAELAELARFCIDPDRPSYVWWQAGPWAGKSALLSSFVLNAPAGLAGRARLVSFFVTPRLAAQDTRETFTLVMLEQLSDLLGETLPDVLPGSTREAYLLELMSRASVQCRKEGSRLVLVVDGLDEDRSASTGPDAHSIAGLLPPDPPDGMRVIVAGRPDPPVPDDVPGWHPLRDRGIIRSLAASRHARDIVRLSRQELHRLLNDSAGRELLGLLAAARGGLTAPDLAGLAEVPLREVDNVLRTVVGRTLQARPSALGVTGRPEVYLLAHEELQATAVDYLGPAIDGYRQRLHSWADSWRDRGWPEETPEYLLKGYFRLLEDQEDLVRMTALALDKARHDRMSGLADGVEAAVAEIDTVVDRVNDQPDSVDPDLMTALTSHRAQLTRRSSGLAHDGDLGAVDQAGAAATPESEIHSLISTRQYADAQAAIDALATADPGTAQRLHRELGFLSLPEPDRHLIALAWRAAGAGHEERLPVDIREPVPEIVESPEDPAPNVTAAQDTVASRPLQSSQQLGTTLENATAALFRLMFADVAPDTLLRQRKQPPGLQFGHDLEFDWEEAGKPVVRCHVECKNLVSGVSTKEVAEKLVQEEFHHRVAPPDQWILISPHQDVSSELRAMLPAWEKAGKYPFGIRVWSPETEVRAWFALEPAAYEEVYGQPPTPEETRKAESVAARYMNQLTPRLRIDPAWRRYLEDPKLICANGEPWQDFAELYRDHLPLKVANEQGTLLDGTLMERVTAWARDETDQRPRLLLADFGEGKSLFTYCLTRRLTEEFRADPAAGVFPLRIPLKDFKPGQPASALLENRLKYIGPSYADWNVLAGRVRTLVILDGFDEMSTDLSPAELTKNLDAIEACIEMFPDSKILITSRERVLGGANARRRTLDRLRKPAVLRVAAGSRRQRVEYLERFATDPVLADRLTHLRDLYDPIGMAAKPLFLQMIKATLLTDDLPLTGFSEQALYRSYIDQSLRKKHKLLRDPGGQLTEDELVHNLLDILEDVAVKLHESNAAYVYLRDYQRTPRERRLAGMLWQMSGQGDEADPADFTQENEDDAVTRVGARSLLKAAPAPESDKWPVDFFHRSMREYFVALAIVRSLGGEARDLERARRLLSASPLLPEVAHFAASILKADPDPADALDTLESLARSATRRSGEKYLGGNAITLLQAAGGRLPHGDWQRLCLDHTDLHGADLHDMDFAHSSLRHANLNNANMECTDLSETVLEGVRLDRSYGASE